MKTVPEALGSLLKSPGFNEFHLPCGTEFGSDLLRFLNSTMDEVRLITSSRIGLKILSTIGISDAGFFREAVLRREVFGNIAYPRQRDHSSHTLYNYLLGWYFFAYSTKIKEALVEEFGRRGVLRHSIPPFGSNDVYFGSVWQYASLLHDVGYMFEGSRPRMDLEMSSMQAGIGAMVAREYFNRTIWLEYGIDLTSARNQLFEIVGASLRPPSFLKTDTLGDISDDLRTIGNLDQLVPAVSTAFDDASLPGERKPDLAELSMDGFDLWAHHYDRFERPSMAKRIRSTRKIFNALIDRGLPGVNICLLDHGVCGGLLQLSASTYYYRLRAICQKINAPWPETVRRINDAGDWSPAFWWTAIVWGTAAVGIHNVQQIESAKQLDPEWPGPLALSEDPLAYLGIMVDVIQEWNRYSVFKDLDREPIQGIEVKLGLDKGKVVVQFLEPNAIARARKLAKDLDQALAGWRELVEICP
jgi:hypothetical protein